MKIILWLMERALNIKIWGFCFMAAYLVIDVDDLLTRLQTRSFAVDMHELATRLRANAALAAGLFSPDLLKAIAVADWDRYRVTGNASLEHIFEGIGFETFSVSNRALF